MEKSNNKITAFNIASTVILQGLAFFSGPIFSGILGTSNYGITVTYLAWVQIAYTVFTLQAAGTIALARVYFPISDQLKYQSSVLSLSFLTYTGFSILTLLFLFFTRSWLNSNLAMVLIGLLQGWGMYCVQFLNNKFVYEFKAGKNFIFSVSTAVLTIGLSLVLVYNFSAANNYLGRILGQAVIYILLGTAISIYVFKAGKTTYNKQYWKFTLPVALPTVFHSLSNIVLLQSDKVMLQGLLGNSATGIYSLACTFSGVLNAIWNALNNSWVAFYYEYTRLGQIDTMKRHARNYIELFTILTMGFILLAKEIFHVYANSAFWEGTDFIPLFSIGYYFVFLYSFCVNYEFYHKKTNMVAIATASAAVSNIILNYICIQIWGILGAVIATTLAHGFQFVFHYISVQKIHPGEFPFKLKEFVPGLLAVCGTYILYIFTKDLWYIRWGLGFILGIYLLSKIIKRREIF